MKINETNNYMGDSLMENELTQQELNELRYAKNLLENPGIAAKLTNIVGKPLEKGMQLLPARWTDIVNSAATKSLRKALDVAIKTINVNSTTGAAKKRHKLAAAASGGIGGIFGLTALAIELPISTTIILRSIAEIARENGESLNDIEAKLACLEVFALGSENHMDDSTETGYYAVRAALAKAVSEAAKYIAEKGIIEEGAPAIVKLLVKISARFGIVVSQKTAASAIPIVGAGGGAVINTIFIDHFQKMATGHFTVRRLERKYGKEKVKMLYKQI